MAAGRSRAFAVKAATGATGDDVVFTTPDGRAMYEWSDFPLRRFQDAIRRLQKRGVDIAGGGPSHVAALVHLARDQP